MLVIILLIFFVLLMLGVPIVTAMGIPALLYAFIKGLPISTISYSIFQSLYSFPLIASPLFILLGNLINEFDETDRLFNFTRVLLRNAKGYTAKVNILLSLIFAGMSGAAVADIGGLGQIEIKAMEGEGFERDYAAALTAATSVVGPIFPPSIPLLIFAVLAEVSTLKCLMAGMIPAIAIVIVMYIFVAYQIPHKLKHPSKVKIKKCDETLWEATKKALPILIMVPLMIASMLFGVFSPSEAGAASIIYLLIVEAVRGQLTFDKVKKSILGTYKTISSVFMIIAIASFFTKVLTLEHFPEMVTNFFLGFSHQPTIILLLINVMVLIVGMFMETIASLTILTPILLQVTSSIGIDPVHLGMILVLNLTIGMLTPPFGVGIFTVCAVGDVPPDKVLRELVPLYVPLIIALLIITFFPGFTMWLPNLIK